MATRSSGGQFRACRARRAVLVGATILLVAGGPSGLGAQACDFRSLASPWPGWVPDWPGQGRNANGKTSFRVFASGSEIENLHVETLDATAVVLAWSTAGDTDSAVAWSSEPTGCEVGFQRSGGRQLHRMVLAPLAPNTTYWATVRSRDENSQDTEQISFTTPLRSPATTLSSCQAITEPGSYRVDRNLIAPCTCFTLGDVEGVAIDFDWHTIRYAQSDAANECHAVEVSYNTRDVAMRNGVLVQGDAGGATYSDAIFNNSGAEMLFERLWIHVSKSDASGIRSIFSNGTIARDLIVASEVPHVTNRHYPGNAGLFLSGFRTDDSDDAADLFSMEVHDNFLFGFPQWGIILFGGNPRNTAPPAGALREVYNNHLFGNMIASNGYGIAAYINRVAIHHNEIRPPYNGRGIHLTHTGSTVTKNIVQTLERIQGDPAEGYVDYSDKHDDASPHGADVCEWLPGHGIRVEDGRYATITANEVLVETLPRVTLGAVGLDVSIYPENGGPLSGSQVNASNNHFVACRAEGMISCPREIPIFAGWYWGEAPLSAGTVTGNRFQSNATPLEIEPGLASASGNTLVSENCIVPIMSSGFETGAPDRWSRTVP